MEKYNRSLTFEEYKLAVLFQYPDYDSLLRQIEEAQVGHDMLLDRVKTLQERSLAYDAAVVAIDVSEGRKDVSELFNVIEKFDHTAEELEVEFVTDNLEELYNETVHTPGLRWRLSCLNESLGSLRKGDFGFLFARPETGKTTFLASETTHFSRQTDKPILWFNNEEQGNKVKVRLYQASLGCSLTKLYSDRQKAYNEYMQRTKGNIKLIDNATIHKRMVEALCKEYGPSLIIFDQIDKIKGFNNDREDLRLGAIYIWARELAKKYCPVIGVCQADVSGEGKKWLNMDNVANAKCFAKDTKVIMYDGTIKAIQDIKIGDRVMGHDSTPRNVTGIASGKEEMFKITHKNGGDSYTVNKSHVLALARSKRNKTQYKLGEHLQLPLTEYLDKCKTFQSTYIGYKVPINFNSSLTNLPINPYFLGVWLGDGSKDKAEITTIDPEIVQTVKDECQHWDCSYAQHLENEHIVHARMKYKQGIKHPFLNKLKELNLYKNKHIPHCYLTSTKEERLLLLAGLLDTDGTLVKRSHQQYYLFSNKNLSIIEGLKFIAESLGFFSSKKSFLVNGEIYWKLHISGRIQEIPCKIERKKAANVEKKREFLKSPLLIESIGEGEYFGITLDGDKLFVLNNFIVVRNTSKQAEADWILGIGTTHDVGMEAVRYLHLSKNKLAGDEDSKPEMRHGRMEVLIKPDIARYQMIGV